MINDVPRGEQYATALEKVHSKPCLTSHSNAHRSACCCQGRAIASAVLQLSQRPEAGFLCHLIQQCFFVAPRNATVYLGTTTSLKLAPLGGISLLLLSIEPELATPTVPRFSCARVAAGGGSKTMPHFTMEQVRSLMDQTEKIRSLSIIAHVDHGKTTLADSLISRAGIISAKVAGEARFTHGRKDEQERGVTIKSTGVTLCFEHDEDGHSQPYLVNLIDSPGHVDFSSEVTAALRITDGAIVVVDCIEGCAVQTETVLRQALQERVKPCLFVNKVDRCILEMQMDAEDMYLRFRTAIENVNVIIATYNDASMGDLQVRPEAGNVAFGSGLHGWGFGVEHFAKMLSAKTGGNKSRMMEKLWGDWFYHPKKKLWTNVQHPEDCQEPLQRGFCQYIMNPINQLIRAIVDKDSERYEKMMERLGIVLKGEEKTLTGKQLMKHVMQNWINAGDSLVSMIVNLPSPKVAQRYRVENLYDGPMDDDAAMGIRNCNPQGPLMMYVSKMVPADKSRFFAFGRVFSGTVATGQKVRIQGPHYKPGTKEDLHVKAIQRTVIMMGRGSELIQDRSRRDDIVDTSPQNEGHGHATGTQGSSFAKRSRR